MHEQTLAVASRARCVEIAKTWLGTPWHHEGRVKGAGVDCGQLLAAVYEEAGVIPAFHVEHYPPDWMLHRSEERYLEIALQCAREIPLSRVGPGDFALWRVGRCYSHGAIVVDWPVVIHAHTGSAVELADASKEPFVTRSIKLFTFWCANSGTDGTHACSDLSDSRRGLLSIAQPVERLTWDS